MKKNGHVELSVGLFIIIGFLALVYLAFHLGEVSWFNDSKRYTIEAEFDNVSGLKSGAPVQIAGVVVGEVSRIWLDKQYAKLEMKIDKSVSLPADSMASVKTQGIIGDKYIQLTIGGDDQMLADGGLIEDTESAVDIESLISKFAFGSVK